jgi:hypothetical protein
VPVQRGSQQGEWERAWAERYDRAGDAVPERRGPRRRNPLRELLLATAVLGVAVTSIAIADTGGDDPPVGAARGEGDPITLGDRNPGSGESTRETAIVANAGNGGLVLRPSNTAKGGRAISATCDNDGVTDEDGCAVYVNKGQGAAASFRTQGSVPFALRSTNNGMVQHLNSDMVDGKHAADFLGATAKAADSETVDGQDSSAFLGVNAKAADAETLDGQDSSAFLGASAKASDANTLDGQDSSAFLGATAKSTDADKLDGADSFDFLKTGGFVQDDGELGNSNFDFTVFKNNTGRYVITYPAGTFETSGQSCSTLVPVVTPFGTTESSTATIESTGCQSNGGGQFTVKTWNDLGNAADRSFLFVVYAFDT